MKLTPDELEAIIQARTIAPTITAQEWDDLQKMYSQWVDEVYMSAKFGADAETHSLRPRVSALLSKLRASM